MDDASRLADLRSRNETVSTDGRSAIQTAILINGGAVAAIMAFVGQGGNSKLSIEPHSIRYSIIIFAVGVAFGGLAAATAYLTNFSYVTQAQFSYQRQPIKANHARKTGFVLHVASAILVLASLIAFISGASFAAKAIT